MHACVSQIVSKILKKIRSFFRFRDKFAKCRPNSVILSPFHYIEMKYERSSNKVCNLALNLQPRFEDTCHTYFILVYVHFRTVPLADREIKAVGKI